VDPVVVAVAEDKPRVLVQPVKVILADTVEIVSSFPEAVAVAVLDQAVVVVVAVSSKLTEVVVDLAQPSLVRVTATAEAEAEVQVTDTLPQEALVVVQEQVAVVASMTISLDRVETHQLTLDQAVAVLRLITLPVVLEDQVLLSLSFQQQATLVHNQALRLQQVALIQFLHLTHLVRTLHNHDRPHRTTSRNRI
jgi:hypothetical protein